MNFGLLTSGFWLPLSRLRVVLGQGRDQLDGRGQRLGRPIGVGQHVAQGPIAVWIETDTRFASHDAQHAVQRKAGTVRA